MGSESLHLTWLFREEYVKVWPDESLKCWMSVDFAEEDKTIHPEKQTSKTSALKHKSEAYFSILSQKTGLKIVQDW